MKLFMSCLGIGLGALVAASAIAGAPPPKGKNPVVVIKTSMGTIKAEIFTDKTPVTGENFLKYVDEKFYDKTIFHRVVPNFVIQGGGFDDKLTKKPTHDPIKNEALSELKNSAGTLSMARTNDPNSATSQFYINVKDNAPLDHRDDTPQGIGYCVFGKVLEGMEVVAKINGVARSNQGGMQDVPTTPVVVESIRRL
jgi:cyclophilin family peptidyl-prolyl cis-trans isomerase